MSPSTSTHSSQPPLTYASLGLGTIINCRGTYTILSGSRLLPSAADAMVEASNHYIHMDELFEAVGRRLAELTDAEWGYVATGCAAAMCEIACAAMTGGDPERMARLPDTTGMPDEIIIQRGHLNSYARSLAMCGARLIAVSTEADLLATISPRTCLIVATGDQHHLGQVPVQRMIEIANGSGIPILVDAAAERPDVPNVYLAMGADAVTYSGGKCLRGPQASGLALGREDLLRAAYLNAAPHHSFGRPMKAGKEEVMGLLAAVEAWILGRDHDAEWRMWERWLDEIREAVQTVPTVETHIVQPDVANVAPMLHITWHQTALGRSYADVRDALYSGEPRIALHLLEDGLRIMPYMMEEGDASLVAVRMSEVLASEQSAASDASPGALQSIPAELSGDWLVQLAFAYGGAQHSMRLVQREDVLLGAYHTPYETTTLSGSYLGERITFTIELGTELNAIAYAFTGYVQPQGGLQGTVSLGEYGQAAWEAERI